MALNYDRVWNKMNSLEEASSKICSARAILDSAIDSLESGNREKTETLMYAVDEYLQYYLEEFDRKFKDAWEETVTKLKQEEVDDCMSPWGHSAMEALSQYTVQDLEGMGNNAAKEDKVVRWQLPVEEDTVNGEYFITFPDDLLEAACLKEGDIVAWIDNGDGTYTLKHKTMSDTIPWVDPYKDEMIAAGYKMVDGVWIMEKKPFNHDEMIAAGYTMTADEFWVKE
jgi:bifunctional DNA-binding transcriptional regulator/antitoxin component of YhaV-PrlF toxin-antitoxin module